MKCEAGTYVRTFCVHIGLLLGVGAHMQVRYNVAWCLLYYCVIVFAINTNICFNNIMYIFLPCNMFKLGQRGARPA